MGQAPPSLFFRLPHNLAQPRLGRQAGLAARLALSVACVGMLVAGAILMRGTHGPVAPQPDEGPSVFDDLRRYQDQILKASVDNRLKEEARNMVADTRRAADVVLTRFPFKAVASR